MHESIFKAYDIRGIYPDQIDENGAYAIGRAIVAEFSPKRLAIGRDVRPSSPSLFAALTRGVTDSGCDVLNLGLTTTPMVYYAAGTLDVDAVVSLTASHNPPEYNGVKIALKGAVPVGEKTGLFSIRDRAFAGNFPTVEKKGTITDYDIKPGYFAHFAALAKFGDHQFTAVVDTANAMGILELELYRMFPKNIRLITMYDDLDHPFTAHEPNPLKTETLNELRERVPEEKADLGIAFDGDADRVGFVDEHGEVIPMDLITGLLAPMVLKNHPGGTVLYDLRSSDAVKEAIQEAGGIPRECPVGHAKIKRLMREHHAVFAGELSGHYYFEENSLAEAGLLVPVLLMNLMAETGKPLSSLVANLRRYVHSGEINSEVEDKENVFATLKEKYADGELFELDGIKIRYPDWWFNVRGSNTEPLIRLNLEARSKELMEQKRDEVLSVIRG